MLLILLTLDRRDQLPLQHTNTAIHEIHVSSLYFPPFHGFNITNPYWHVSLGGLKHHVLLGCIGHIKQHCQIDLTARRQP